ncbi:MAG: hypothetical protein WC460_06885 [Patescibacteria group bacterium]
MTPEKPSKISNFETKAKEAQEIREGTGIPHEIIAKRLDYCAKQEGLKDGYFSSDEEIKNVLDKVGFKVQGIEPPLSVQFMMYLQEKYGDYIWRDYKPKHSHDKV